MTSFNEDPVLAVVSDVCEFFVSSGHAKFSEIVTDKMTQAHIINAVIKNIHRDHGVVVPDNIINDRLQYYCNQILNRLDRDDIQIVRFH